MSGCKGCGAVLEPSRGGSERIWCSERCRKRQYDRVCQRCGGRASGTDPGKMRTDLCSACYAIETHETSVAWLVAEVHHWNDLYGAPPGAGDWNLAWERWRQVAYLEGRVSGRCSAEHLAELERRHRDDGPWPSVSNGQLVFGSWNALIEAAGFISLPTGKKRSHLQAVAA